MADFMTAGPAHRFDLVRNLIQGVAVVVALSGLLMPRQSLAQPAATPKFEVASVRPSTSDETRVTGGFQPGGSYRVTNYTLRALIAAAYARPQINPDFLIAGGPKWIDSDHFDVDAKAAQDFPPGPDGPSAPRRVALQALLADRFRLKVHNETRQGPVYALVWARSDKKMGPHLRPSSLDCTSATAAVAVPGCVMRIGPGSVTATGRPLSALLNLLPRFVDRVVIDSTGLAGPFDLELTWTPAPGEWVAPPFPVDAVGPLADGPSLFTALQEQLGLKLQGQVGPVDMLVVDSVERPSGN